MINQLILTLLVTLFFTQAAIAQSTGAFTDSRDGQTYKTISFKNTLTGTTATWMAQNLNYKVEGSYAYDDKENNRKELGLLYTWEAAKKACPSGWHLATDNEWSLLVNEFGGTDKAGEALKSIKGWNEDGNGTNSSGFNALPAGIRRKGSYEVLGTLGFFWTSSPTNSMDRAWAWNFHYGGTPSSNKQNLKKAFRCRCCWRSLGSLRPGLIYLAKRAYKVRSNLYAVSPNARIKKQIDEGSIVSFRRVS